MRSLKQEKRLVKLQARQQSMAGWNTDEQGFGKRQIATGRNSQRKLALGIGHHFARMMKGHI